MNVVQYVNQNQLQPADAIVLRKKIFGMVDHYAIYLGTDSWGKPQFIANFNKGVNMIPEEEITTQLDTYIPEKVERFPGENSQREFAVQRALSKLGDKTYNYLSNNCEHFKNIVHYGEAYSRQVDNLGNALSVGGTTMAVGGILLSSKKTRNWGVGVLAFGILLKLLASNDKEVSE